VLSEKLRRTALATISRDEDTRSAVTTAVLLSKESELFDIVNGFFKSMP
jgi:hypothetical protein